MLSFQNKKELRFVITLATGAFGSSKLNTITLEGFRANADINKAGGAMMSELRAEIYGVEQGDMNSVTTLMWKPNRNLLPNTVTVYAIDGPQETLVFRGNIVNAWGNYQSMPDVFLQIQAQSAFVSQLTPVAPVSIKGAVDVGTLMGQLAQSMGYTFENNGVDVQLSNPYLPNTAMEQAKALARAAGVNLYLDDNVLAITPPNAPRGGFVPDVTPASGLRGYPLFDGIGVTFETLFTPGLRFGGSFNLVTSIAQAAGKWIAVSINHRLQSQNPGGMWHSTVRGNQSGLIPTS